VCEVCFVVRLRGEAGVDVAEDDEGAGAHAQGGHGPPQGHQQVAPRWDLHSKSSVHRDRLFGCEVDLNSDPAPASGFR
jgi:hypothetical protein